MMHPLLLENEKLLPFIISFFPSAQPLVKIQLLKEMFTGEQNHTRLGGILIAPST